MRNVFDQYAQNENRLTHALACTLVEDPRLLRGFVRWATGTDAPQRRLYVTEQTFPGEPEPAEGEAEKLGIPDAWIYTDNGWTLLIETKVQADLRREQLMRHVATAKRRGFLNPRLLALTAKRETLVSKYGVITRRWDELYRWLAKQRVRSDWARKLMTFLEVSERKFVASEYLWEGALTVFSGIPFSADEPYSYLEAKRLLRLMTDELRKRRRLVRTLSMDPKGAGRGAITGSQGTSVWDFLPLKISGRLDRFTNAPHLTISIQQARLSVAVIIPNALAGSMRRQLASLDFESFRELMRVVTSNLAKVANARNGAQPCVEVLQRHYPALRASPIVDARLEFDPRTAFPSRGRIKHQPEWLRAAHAAFSKRRANTQLMIGMLFPYGPGKTSSRPEIIDDIEEVWLGCKPLIDAMLKRK